MFVRSKHYQNYLIKTRIELGKFFDQPNADVFVELREMSSLQGIQFSKVVKSGDKEELLEHFQKILPILIVDHNFYIDENTRMPNKDITAIIFEKMEVLMHVISKYSERVSFLSQAPKPSAESNQSPTISSEDTQSTPK